MSRYNALSDDFYVNMNLNTEMELPSNRETVLHYFEQIQKRYPTLRNFYARDRNEYVLEEEKLRGKYRWTTIEPRRICAGQVNPEEIDDAVELHAHIMELAPFFLSVSPLDCESLNLMFGFDYTYRGNHNQLVAETLGVLPAMEPLLEASDGKAVSYEPSIQIAFDDDCQTQCRLSVETRTTAYQVRTGDYPEDQLSVYITARRYGSLAADESLASVIHDLFRVCQDVVDGHVTENILRPLQQAIALR